jgi:hypothetical protein
MLKDLVVFLRQHLTEQEKILPVRLDWAPRIRKKVAFWDPAVKQVDFLDAGEPCLRHKVRNLSSLIAYLNASQKPDSGRRIVWFGEKKIVADMDECDGCDVLEMELRYTQTWIALETLARVPSVTQQEAIRLLKQRFSGHGTALQALTACQSLRLKKTEDFDSDQSHDMSRVGKSIAKEAVGANSLPEYVTVECSVFDDGSMKSFVKIWLSIDFENNKLLFEPDMESMEKAKKDARAEYLSSMSDELKNASVYEGEYCVTG